jgi:UDP-2,3-diacylglucosamine hydrolase
MKTLFISDLHLKHDMPDIQPYFNDFIDDCLSHQSSVKALYILGDLFETWLGDDASMPLYNQVIRQLKQLNANNIAVYIMHGNRDFLLGSAFEQASHCTLIPDLYHLKLRLDNKVHTILLSHGDILCTDDTDYMKFRQMVRHSQWQKEFLSHSISRRITIAKALRQQSQQQGQIKQQHIMDVNQKAVAKIMSEQQVSMLIHGHTHRPATHNFLLHQQQVKRIVLPSWEPDAAILEINEQSI